MKRQITTARREILLLLRRGGPQTVDTLSTEMGITPVGVRKHLDTLEIDGLVQSVIERRPIGRPVQVYSLTEAAEELFPQAYDAALASILRQVTRMGGENLLCQVLDGRREEQEAAYREHAGSAASLEEQIQILTQVRNEAGYMAEWVRASDHFLLKEYNCALCRVAREFPQLCESEMYLFQRLLGEHVVVERTEHILAGSRGCAYEIRERPAE